MTAIKSKFIVWESSASDWVIDEVVVGTRPHEGMLSVSAWQLIVANLFSIVFSFQCANPPVWIIFFTIVERCIEVMETGGVNFLMQKLCFYHRNMCFFMSQFSLLKFDPCSSLSDTCTFWRAPLNGWGIGILIASNCSCCQCRHWIWLVSMQRFFFPILSDPICCFLLFSFGSFFKQDLTNLDLIFTDRYSTTYQYSGIFENCYESFIDGNWPLAAGTPTKS